jgi:hypothetical protein
MKHCQDKTQKGDRGTERRRERMTGCTRHVFIPPMLLTPWVGRWVGVCVCWREREGGREREKERERRREIEIEKERERE